MTIFDKVATILNELCETENIYPEQELTRDLALDSLQMVTLLIMVEDNFNIVLDEADMNPFALNTVMQIVELIEKYIGCDNDEKTC